MKCVRVIEYEAETEEELKRHLDRTLMSMGGPVVSPGWCDGINSYIFSAWTAPKVTIRLRSEEWE